MLDDPPPLLREPPPLLPITLEAPPPLLREPPYEDALDSPYEVDRELPPLREPEEYDEEGR